MTIKVKLSMRDGFLISRIPSIILREVNNDFQLFRLMSLIQSQIKKILFTRKQKCY